MILARLVRLLARNTLERCPECGGYKRRQEVRCPDCEER